MSDIVIACVGIFIGELYGSFVGGGSIATQFFLQNLIGMDLKPAIALDNAAVIGSELGLLFVLLFKGNRPKLHHIPFVLAFSVGSYIGAHLLYIVPEETLRIIFAIAVLFVVVKSILSKDPEATGNESFSSQKILGLVLFGFLVGAYNSFLSIGDFIIGLIGLIAIFKLSYVRALFWLCLALVFGRSIATVKYFDFGFLDLDYLIPMFITAATAGVISGYIITKVDMEKLKPGLKIIGVILAIFLIYNTF